MRISEFFKLRPKKFSGGAEGRILPLKALQYIMLGCLGGSGNQENYECEFIFTIRDNFGVGLSDAKKWYIPGVVAQWVLQHYRNYDTNYCTNPPCFVPITSHIVEVHHIFQFCK